MTTHSDFLIGRIALERGLVSVDQLAECLSDQRAPDSAPLGSIMLRKGLIKQSDLDALIEEQKRRLADALELTDPKLEDALLGRLLIKQGLVKEAQLYECLRASAEIGEQGQKSPRLGELLVRKGFLSTDAVDRILLAPKKDSLVCGSCGAHHSALAAEPGKTYRCKQCGGALARSGKKGDTTEMLKVDLPADVAEIVKDPGRQFASGKYLLVQEVGRGGMGVVWKAWQVELRRYAAIKILVGTMWTDVELKRFYREAQMAASLSHPNIASIYEVGVHEGKHFIAMEYVDGDSLARLMAPPVHKTGTARAVKYLPPRRAIEILRETALAVDYAHSKKIIHRDLKPHNIMVQKGDGRVYVMDFGLAKPIRSADSITISDAIVGTPQYMSPEQARGDTVDRRTDVYSLGAVLYHALTGRAPFEGHSPAEVMMSVLADDPESIRKINPRIHADVETICLKALDKDRERRYDSARSLADDLGRYLEGEPIAARPLSRRERLWRHARRHPIQAVVAAAAVAAVLLLGVLFGAMSWLTRSKVDDLVAQAAEFNRTGKHEQAKEFANKARGLDPDNFDALREWEFAEERIRDRDRQLDRDLARRRADVIQWHKDADVFFKEKLYPQALGVYERILGVERNDTLARQRLRDCHDALEREDAEDSQRVQKVINLEHDLEARRKEDEERRKARRLAFPYYERAREAALAAASMRLAADGLTPLDVTQTLQEARDALTRAIEKDPTYAEARYFRGEIKHWMAQYDLAEHDFEEARKLSSESGPPTFGAALSQLARYMLHTHAPEVKLPQARADSLKAMRASAEILDSPNTQNPFHRWCSKALLDFEKGQFKRAEEDLKPIEKEGRKNYFYYFLTGCIQLETDDFRAARQSFAQALELRPTSVEALFLSGIARMRASDLAGALLDARRAAECLPPKDSSVAYSVHLLLARLYRDQGETPQAVVHLRLASERTPDIAPQVGTLVLRWTSAPR
jgi:serine/threonine protein kinase/Tfp pilus assembly protein PilF